jgi:hypothetical protein
LSTYPAANARESAPFRGIRPRDLLLLIPAVALGLILLAVHQADSTGSPLSSILSADTLASLVPNALDAGVNQTP